VASEPSTLKVSQELIEVVVHREPSTLKIAQQIIEVLFIEFWGEGTLLSGQVNSLIVG